MSKAKRTRKSPAELDSGLCKKFKNTNYRLKTKTPIGVYMRCAELRYGKTEGPSQTNKHLSPEVLDVAAFTCVMCRLSAREVERIVRRGIPTGLLEDLSTLSLPMNWRTCCEAINSRDARLGYLYSSEIGRYIYQHANDQMRSAALTNDDCRRAILASETRIKTVFENYLFLGFQQSNKKSRETYPDKITDAVRMYLPLQYGLDIVLQIWVSSTVGKHFFDARMGLVDYLEGMLGGQIFTAMESSCLRKEEKKNHVLVGTKAIHVVPEGDDFRIEIGLGFNEGFDIYLALFS